MEKITKAQAVSWSREASRSERNDQSIGEKLIQHNAREFSCVQIWRHHHREFSTSKD